jgi:hypothetical protein
MYRKRKATARDSLISPASHGFQDGLIGIQGFMP